jgi:photosystem II stability/assembly factor-like uncharacterized protein
VIAIAATRQAGLSHTHTRFRIHFERNTLPPLIHIATRKGLFTLARNSRSWSIAQASFLGDNCSMSLHDPRDGAIYAALDHGHFGVKLHRSRDGGKSWQEIAVPVYPEKPADYKPALRPAEGEPVAWALKLIWALEAGSARQPGRLWCGTAPGGLFVSDDHGDSWRLIESLWLDPRREEWFGGGLNIPGIHSIAVDPRDHDHISVGVSCGGVWHTRDGGDSWTVHQGGMRAEFMPPERAYDANIQDPHRLVACPASPDRMWVQHHNGIFRSDDGGMNWVELSENATPASFGFAVVVHPHDADTAWFVPGIKDEKRIPVDGRLVVMRTRDGGTSFEQLTNGLPQEHAYDLIFRHALDIGDAGDLLAFGSTTGSVFISEDGGERWQCASNHLPPVHAVRFSHA